MSERAMWRVIGVPIRIDPSWYAIAVILAWSLSRDYFPTLAPGLPPAWYGAVGIAAALLLFGCVLLHELAHALMARAFKIPVAAITLFVFGGVAQIGHTPRRPWMELLIAAVGPLVSVLIAAGCFFGAGRVPFAGPPHLVARALLHYLAMVNAVVAVFNLLPGFPLDGGRLVRASVWAITGNLRKATRVASFLGALLGLLLLALGIWQCVRGAWFGGLWYVFLGYFLYDAASASFRAARR